MVSCFLRPSPTEWRFLSCSSDSKSWLHTLTTYRDSLASNSSQCSMKQSLSPSDNDLDPNSFTDRQTCPMFAHALRRDISQHSLPPPDLAISLVNLYFERFNTVNPILHRPSFERALAAGTQDTNDSFKSLVFSVLAVASRFSNDQRVYCDFGYLPLDSLQMLSITSIEGRCPDATGSLLNEQDITALPSTSAGWAFSWVAFCAQTPMTAGNTLADLQASLLICHYHVAAVGASACWSLAGYYIRRAQDARLHCGQRTSQSSTSVLEEESVSLRKLYLSPPSYRVSSEG